MIKDTFLKVLFIPLLAVWVPLYSSLVVVHQFTVSTLILAVIYFAVLAVSIWNGVVRITSYYRGVSILKNTIFLKLLLLTALALLFSIMVAGAAAILWQELFLKAVVFTPVLRCSFAYGAAAIIMVPIYEAAFLSKERELDIKIVNQLDEERISAEISSLKSEMDPHFIFNSLNTLSYLIHADAEKALLFNNKLAQVYKYFLINKDRELVSLQKELEFIEDYFFLLKIRHEDKLQLHIRLDGAQECKSMVIPYALQILVENAIKHNQFSENNPLQIDIDIAGRYIHVVNNLKPKPYMVDTTNIGLKNLRHRYQLICNKNIVVDSSRNQFLVKLPLITQ